MDLVQSEERSCEKEGGLRKVSSLSSLPSFVGAPKINAELLQHSHLQPKHPPKPLQPFSTPNNLQRTLETQRKARSCTDHEINILLIRMPLKLQRQLIQIVHPDLRLVDSRSHSMVTVRCCSNLEGSLWELKVLDELDMTERPFRLRSLLALLVLGSLG